jgi:hypothetical protein
MQSLAIVVAAFGLVAVPAAVGAEAVPIEGTFLSGGQHNPEGETVGQNTVLTFVTIFNFGIEGSGFVGILSAEVTNVFHPSGALTTRHVISPDSGLFRIGVCGADVESTVVFIGHRAPSGGPITGTFHTIGGEGPQLAGTFVREGGTWTYSGHVVCDS